MKKLLRHYENGLIQNVLKGQKSHVETWLNLTLLAMKPN